MEINPIFIPIIAILMPVFIVFIVKYFKAKERADMQLTMRKALESGQTLPTEFLQRLDKVNQAVVKTPMNDIRAGLILMAVAGGMMTWGYLDDMSFGGGLTGVAAIPGFIGVALFILGLIGLANKKN